ncbi:MAG: TonB-dependent receptor [Magnetospirillum sp.]|nr:TonB-dependent receptor [Magnetospirillum sp.]
MSALGAGLAQAAFINGSVRNLNTGAYLEGARITIVETGTTVTTSRDGTFSLKDVAAGTHTLRISYSGLDTRELEVRTSETATDGSVNVELTSDVYQLDSFVVTTEREGNAAAITAQRNAPTMQNVISTDAFGNLADGNIGNLIQRLPGVDQSRSNGDVIGVGVRGIPQNLSTVSLDGANLSAANGGSGSIGDRAYPIDNLPAEMIASVELSKALRPDMPADSLGGNINLKTKSALDIRGRRINYRVGMNTNLNRSGTEWTPTAAVTYMDTIGEKRPTGITVTGSYSKATNTRDRLQNSLGYAPDTQTVINTRLRLLDDIVERVRIGGGIKLERDFSDRLRVGVDFLATDTKYELDRSDHRLSGVNRIIDYARVSRANIFNGTQGRNTANQTASIAPGFTDTFQEVLHATNQYYIADESRHNKMYKLGAYADYKLDDGWVKLRASFNPSKSNYFLHQMMAQKAGGFGYSLDTSKEAEFPVYTHLYGVSVYSDANLNGFDFGRYMFNPVVVRDEVLETQIDWRKEFNRGAVPIAIQAGAFFRDKIYDKSEFTVTYNYLGADGVQGRNTVTGINDDNLAQFYRGPTNEIFGIYPSFYSLDVQKAAKLFQDSPSQFSVLNPAAIAPLATFEETITGIYAMGQVQLNKLSILAGVRGERTDVDARGSVLRAGATDYEIVRRDSVRDDAYPSVHLRYEILPNLFARASWSTGIGRAPINQQLPVVQINSLQNGSSVLPNPDLRPMFSNNFDLSLQYYFKGVGVVSVGAFDKQIDDFISRRLIPGSELGEEFGELSGYGIYRYENLSAARIRGFEADYTQVIPFLPAKMQGSTLFANVTLMDTSGEFSDGASKLNGFSPILVNTGFSVKYGRALFRASYKYQAGGMSSYNADPLQRIYSTQDVALDLNASYQISRRYTLYCDVINVFDDAPMTYIISKRHILTKENNGTRISLGISGRF